MAQNIFSQLAQQTLSTATAPAGGGAAGDDDPTSAITAVAQEHGVNPNFLLGLAQLETRGGKATVKGQGVDSRNLFNIKDFSKAGTGIRALDKAEGSNDPYRRYDSASDSARDLVRLLGSKRYEGALTAQTPEEFAAALKRGGYATDPDHDKKVIATIRSIEAKGGTPAPAPAQPWDQGARYVPMEHMVPGGPPAHNPNKNPDFLRGAGDVALSFLQGAAGSVKSVTDLAGAGNAVSRGLDDVSKGLGQLKSEEAQQSLAYHQQKIKDAETNGDWKQEMGAYADMVWDMPADSLAQALGSLVTLGVGKAAQVVKLASSARRAGMTKEAFLKTAQGVEAAKKASNLGAGVNLGLGVGQGVGGVKGEQYERTYNAAKEEGLADDEAQALATEAQSYGKGWMQQAAGAALGYAAAKTGPLEKLASGQTVGAGGVLRRLAGGAGIEGATEGLQGGQARYAGNTAAIDAGVLDESQRFAGVAGTAFSEGLLGGVVGGGAGALGHPDVDPLATTKEAAKKPNSPISRAAVASQPTKPEQPSAQAPVTAGAGAQSQEADPTFAEMSDSMLLQLQRSLQERQAAGDEDITDDEIELAQAAKTEYERRMASAPPTAPDPEPAAPAQTAGVFVSEEVQPAPAEAQPAITVDLNPAPRAPSPFDAVPMEQDPAITQQQREDAAKVQERRSKRMAALRLGAYNKNPMMEFLGRHGLQPETQNEFAPGTTERRKASVYGYGPVFRQNGKPLDLLLSNAQDEGFLPPEASESDLYDLVARAINGERVEPLYKVGSADALMQRLAAEREAKEAASYEDFLAQQQALAEDPDYDPFATFADTENDYDVSDLDNSGYSQAEKSLQAEVSALAQAYSQLGFDADDVLEPLAIQYESNPDEYYAQARQRLTQLIAQAAQPRGDGNLPQDSGEQTQAPIGREAANATSADDDALIDYAIEDDGEPDYFLQAQTARQLREREDAIAEQARLNAERQQALEAKAQADDERKRIEQASVQAADTFELGQNALDNLTGQADLLAQMPTAQAESPAPAATQPTAKPQDGDILNDNGKPFAFEYGAKLRAQKDGGEVVQVEGGYVVRPTQGEAKQADPVAGDKIDDEWTAFSEQSGTLGTPRAEMPQVKAQDRGAMVNFLKARGIDSSNEVMPANAIKPTQAEFSPAKVQEAANRQDGNRSIIVSADGYVVDGHHQWMAQRQNGEPVKVIKLDQPIGQVLQALKGMPSAQPEQAATQPAAQDVTITNEGNITPEGLPKGVPATFNNPSDVPPQPGVYRMRDGTFARFDHGIWWRSQPTAKEALLTEFSGEDQMSPENRYSTELAWAPYATISGRDAFGEASAMRRIPAKPAEEISPDHLQAAGVRWEAMDAAQREDVARASGLSDTVKPKAPQQVWSNFTPEMQQHLYRSMSEMVQSQPVANEDNLPEQQAQAPASQTTVDPVPQQPRPAGWERNYGAAKTVAESLGIAPRGDDGKLKKVPQLVADIKTLDATQGQASSVTSAIDTSPAAKWRNNWGEAKRTAESLGLSIKNADGRNLRLPQMVPAIEAKLARQQMAAAAPDSTQVKAAESVPQQTDTPLSRAEAALADWKARLDLPANAGNVADVDKEIDRLEQTVAALKKIDAVQQGNDAPLATSDREKPSIGNSVAEVFDAWSKTGGDIKLQTYGRIIGGNGEFFNTRGKVQKVVANGTGTVNASAAEIEEIQDAIAKGQFQIYTRNISGWRDAGGYGATQPTVGERVVHEATGIPINRPQSASKPISATQFESANATSPLMQATQDSGKLVMATVGDKKPDPFAGNKIFTADKVAAARARMKSKLGQLNSGIDPELLVDGMTVAGAYIESGVRKFSDYAKAMIEDMGDGVKPYLLSFWEGARNYPGLDTKGMTSVEDSAREHAELLKPEDAKTEAVGTVAEKPKVRKKKTGERGDMVLTQDWGVTHIDGYADGTRGEVGNATKDAFLKEAKNYLNAVADALIAFGYEPHADRKGKPEKPVSVNESGVAGSGDVSLTMRNPETGNNAYIKIGDTALRGVVSATPSGIGIMYRIGTGDRYATRSGNKWAPVDLSANELATLVHGSALPVRQPAPASEALRQIDNAVQIQPQQENTNDTEATQANAGYDAAGGQFVGVP